jgi:hypothetical protein
MKYLHEKHFSIEEANNLLDEIKSDIEELISLKRILDQRGYDIFSHSYLGGSGPNGTGSYPEELDKLIEILKSLNSKGVIVKAIERGLIDFPHIRATGEEVYLCWKYGEGEINWWHKIPDGFAGRRNISEL